MKKIALIAIVVVAVVLIAACVVPIAFRGKIAEIVKREANARLRATLDFEKFDISLLRHFPNASLELKDLTVIAADPFAGDTVLAAQRISVVVNLLSVFGDEGFEVSKLFVTAPQVHARKLTTGAVNWDLVQPSGTTDSTASASTPSSFRLRVRDVRLSDVCLRYEDDSTGMRFSTSPAALRLRGDLSAERTALQVNLSAQGMRLVSAGIPLLNDAEAEIDAVIDADLKNHRYTFSNNELRLNAIQVTLDGWVELRDKALALDLKAGCDKVQFKDVLSLVPAFYTREFRNLAASGELSMSLWARGVAQGRMLPAFEVKTEVRNGSFQYSSLPKAVTDIALAAKISNPGGVADKTEVDISRLSLTLAGNALSATLYATNLASDPVFRATASGRLDLGSISQVYPLPETVTLDGEIAADVKLAARMSDVDQKRYEQISAAGTFVVERLGLTLPSLPQVFIRRAAATITPATMTLGDFGATIGSSDITANGQLTGYIGYLLRGDLLSGRLYVKSELLDLNEIMDAGGPDADEQQDAQDAPEPPSQTLVVPCNLNLSLSTDLQEILLRKMILTNLTGEMQIAGGVVALDNLTMNLFGGRAGVSGSYSTVVDPRRPVLKLSTDIAGASFAKTFEQAEVVQRLVPLFEKTGGEYSLSLNLSTAFGAQMTPEVATLDATGELRSANIQLQNIGAFDALATALKDDAFRRIEARDVAIRFTIRDGRVYTRPFDLQLGGVTINLSGSTGLDQSIDYVAKVALPSSVTGGLLSSVNVGIGGTFTAPKITLDVKQAAQEAIKQVLGEQVQRLTGSENLSAELQKQTSRLREEAQRAGDKLVEAAQSQRTKLIEGAAAKGALAKLAAEKAGDKLVEAAQKQAEKLIADAQTQIDRLAAPKQ